MQKSVGTCYFRKIRFGFVDLGLGNYRFFLIWVVGEGVLGVGEFQKGNNFRSKNDEKYTHKININKIERLSWVRHFENNGRLFFFFFFPPQ